MCFLLVLCVKDGENRRCKALWATEAFWQNTHTVVKMTAWHSSLGLLIILPGFFNFVSGAHQEALRGERGSLCSHSNPTDGNNVWSLLDSKMKANGFWTRANINAALQHTPVQSGTKAFSNDYDIHSVKRELAVIPGPVESLKDFLGQTCRWRCLDPAAGEQYAPRRTVSVKIEPLYSQIVCCCFDKLRSTSTCSVSVWSFLFPYD